jgi:hypothetical protein
MFAPNEEMVAGYREGNRKFVYNLARNKFYVYDLSTDPEERQNIAEQDPGQGRLIRGQLSGWLKGQELLYEELGYYSTSP